MNLQNVPIDTVDDEISLPKENSVYEFDKNNFIVESVFDEKSNNNLSSILIRLIENKIIL